MWKTYFKCVQSTHIAKLPLWAGLTRYSCVFKAACEPLLFTNVQLQTWWCILNMWWITNRQLLNKTITQEAGPAPTALSQLNISKFSPTCIWTKSWVECIIMKSYRSLFTFQCLINISIWSVSVFDQYQCLINISNDWNWVVERSANWLHCSPV